MKVGKWHVVDVFYNDHEAEKAAKIVRQYQRQGYSLEGQDDGSPFDRCYQLIKWFPRKTY